MWFLDWCLSVVQFLFDGVVGIFHFLWDVFFTVITVSWTFFVGLIQGLLHIFTFGRY